MWTEVGLALGLAKAIVHIEVFPPPKKGKLSWRLRVDCNPSKLGPDGITLLTQELVASSLGQLKLPAAFAATRLTYLETACDLLGVEPIHIVVRSELVAKIVHYLAAGGSLQTEYGSAWKKKGEGHVIGHSVYCLYDKRRELIDAGLSPPHGDVPVTRVERRRHWRGHNPLLADIASLSCQFSDIRVGYLREGIPKHLTGWARYAYLRRSTNAEQCRGTIGLSNPAALELEQLYSAFPFNAFDPAEWWQHWADSLISSGLNQLLVGH